jgi:hypothetical protein
VACAASTSRSTRTRSRPRPRASRPRAERARSRLRQAAIDKRARPELTPVAVQRLESLGLLGAVDEPATRAELRELEAALDAVEELQTWLEGELASAA